MRFKAIFIIVFVSHFFIFVSQAIEIKGFTLFPRFRYWHEVLEELIYFSHRKYNLFIL